MRRYVAPIFVLLFISFTTARSSGTKNSSLSFPVELQSAVNSALKCAEALHIQADKLAIADFSKSSDQKRFFIVDLKTGEVLLQTWVAHGKNSGELYARSYSNTPESHQSSKGLFKIGSKIMSPKHGESLLLYGLERGVNDKALEREIIMHGADYVSEAFIRQQGRCGRSYGCPALPREDIHKAISLLPEGSLLFIYSGD